MDIVPLVSTARHVLEHRVNTDEGNLSYKLINRMSHVKENLQNYNRPT
jgi:hypothetical protein